MDIPDIREEALEKLLEKPQTLHLPLDPFEKQQKLKNGEVTPKEKEILKQMMNTLANVATTFNSNSMLRCSE
jgi:hypothetical protein